MADSSNYASRFTLSRDKGYLFGEFMQKSKKSSFPRPTDNVPLSLIAPNWVMHHLEIGIFVSKMGCTEEIKLTRAQLWHWCQISRTLWLGNPWGLCWEQECRNWTRGTPYTTCALGTMHLKPWVHLLLWAILLPGHWRFQTSKAWRIWNTFGNLLQCKK